MWRERVSTTMMVALVCAAVVGLALAARATMHLKKVSGDFRQEVSQRFDLEAKIAGMEKQLAAAVDQIRSLTNKLKDSESAMDGVKDALEKEREEKKALADTLNKLQSAETASAVNKT